MQEDNNSSFSSPVAVYNGSLKSKSFSGKPNGEYFYRVNCTNDCGTGEWSNTVDLTVQLPQPSLSVSPINLDFGTDQTSMTFNITNSGTGALTWNISDNKNWITTNPVNGSTTTETDQITVTIDRTGLTPGQYNGVVTVSSNDGTETVDISMTVPTDPQITVSPSFLDFGSTLTSKTFDITNSGTGTLTWNISDNKTWITTNPVSGNTTTETDQITVTIDRSNLAPGTYDGLVTVTSNDVTKTVDITMTVNTNPILAVSPTILDFGTNQTSKTFDITNSGSGTLTWDISKNQAWIAVNPISGQTTTETDLITVTIDRYGLATGSYNGTVTITSNDGTETVDISMTVPCDITVTDPHSGRTWTKGDSRTIQWTSGYGSVKVELYKGSSKRCTIAASTSNDGSYGWTVDDCNGGTSCDYQIKITNVSDASCYDYSDMFEIQVTEIDTCFAIADAFVSQDMPDYNFGSESTFWVGWFNSNEELGFVKYDLSPIPNDAIIESAYLVLWCVSNHSLTYMKANLVQGSWNENTITYNNKPSIYSQPQHSWSVPSQGGLIHRYNVVNLVRPWFESGYSNYGLRLAPNMSGSANYIIFSSKDGNPGWMMPRLEISYTVPCR